MMGKHDVNTTMTFMCSVMEKFLLVFFNQK